MEAKGDRGFSCTFTDPKDASELLVALGRQPDRVATRVKLEPSLLTMGFHPLPLWQALASIVIATVALIVLLPVVGRATVGFHRFGRLDRFVNRTLELGADGLRIRTILADEFVAYREIADAHARGDALHLVLRDGRECTFPLTHPTRTAEVIARITQAIAAAPAATADAEAASLLRDVAGDKASKVTALRELGAEDASTYRETRLPRERLWELFEDPHVEGVTRTRAAVALSGALEPNERERMRVAIDATVSPKVRVALDTIAREDDAGLADQLEALDEESVRVEGEHASDGHARKAAKP
jgi:hypothetical protein